MATTEMNCLASGGGGMQAVSRFNTSFDEITSTTGKFVLGFKPKYFMFSAYVSGMTGFYVLQYDADVDDDAFNKKWSFDSSWSSGAIPNSAPYIKSIDDDGITIGISSSYVFSQMVLLAVG